MKFRHISGLILIAATVSLAGCANGHQQYNAGEKAESVKDYDTALDQYNKALQAQPNNTEYQLRAARARFEAGQWHVDQGRRLRQQSNLELAMAEFRKASMIDPSSAVAAQELQATLDLIAAKQGTTQNAAPQTPASSEPKLMAGPPQIQPLSRAPINMKATNDAKAVFDAIGKLAGLTVIFDLDFTSRRISVELTNVTLEQALNIAALQSKAFWRPVTSNIIFVAPDQPQKRKDYEEEIVKTFYLQNITSAAGVDGNYHQHPATARPAARAADQRAERHCDSRHAGPGHAGAARSSTTSIRPSPKWSFKWPLCRRARTGSETLESRPGQSVGATFSPSTTTTTDQYNWHHSHNGRRDARFLD